MPLYRKEDASGLVLPVETRTTAIDDDYVFMIDSTTNIPYRITKADLLAGLTSGTTGGTGGSGGTGNTWNGTVVFKSLFDSTPPVDIAANNTISLIGTAAIDSSTTLLSGSTLFTGSSGYASIPNKSEYNFGGSDFTIDFFVKFNSVNAGTIVNKYGGSQSNSSFVFQINSGNTLGTYFYYSGSNYLGITDIPVTVNTLYYVAVKRVGDTISLWVNGVMNGSANIGTNTINATTANILIGSEPGGSYYGNFRMDNFRITIGGDNDLSIIPTA
ncbi:MAG: LamG domain-containing protein [Nostoc sp.]|uniref:LamG domain-containing protein n=1 Tax=Nostoc sp. TaxID=1180 RepID=UPI002FF928FB